MTSGGYAARLARLPTVLAALEDRPGGLPLAALARSVGADPAEVQEDLLAYYSADLPALLERGVERPVTLEFFTPGEDDDVDPTEATWVRAGADSPLDELGVTWLSAADAAVLADAARAALDLGDDDPALRGAVDALHEQFLAGAAPPGGSGPAATLALLRHGCEERTRVRLTYSRAWQVGVVERVVDPYRLVRTGRGWELDAGPLDDQGRPRTYLLSGIRSATALDEWFTTPPDLDAALMANRAEQRALLRLPANARWVAETYAERVAEVGEDERGTLFEVWLLPPVRHRVGLLLATAGPAAAVIEPAGLRDAGAEVAADLLAAYAVPHGMLHPQPPLEQHSSTPPRRGE